MDKPKKDYAFTIIATLLFVAAFAMFIAGIWVDFRWFITSIVTSGLAIFSAWFSVKLDERYVQAFKERQNGTSTD